jgi:hypothetical protein
VGSHHRPGVRLRRASASVRFMPSKIHEATTSHAGRPRGSRSHRGSLSSNGSRRPVGPSRDGSRRRPLSAIALWMLFSFTRTLAKVTRSRGAKRGATADRFQATPGHCQPPSTQLNPTSGDVRPPPGTHRRCLLSSGSRVRILPGALVRGLLGPLGPVPAGSAARRDWEHKAAPIAAYREMYGYGHPDDPIGPEPVRNEDRQQPGLERRRRGAF